MEYLKIKKKTFLEIVISALMGMTISLIAVLLLVNQIILLKHTLEIVEKYDSQILVQEVQEDQVELIEEETNQTTIQETEKINENLNKTIANKSDKVYTEIDDRELLAKLLYCEGRGESVECQKAIVSVVINRLNNGYWGDTINKVVYAKGQFTPALNGTLENVTPTKTQYEVVDYILENGSTLPSWVMYFRASYHFNWKGYTPYCAIDNTYFGGMQ